MDRYREIEKCPNCNRNLEHFDLKGKNVYGCLRCKKEITRKEALIVTETYCLHCNGYFDINEEHNCFQELEDIR